jgi:hypothetical protein
MTHDKELIIENYLLTEKGINLLKVSLQSSSNIVNTYNIKGILIMNMTERKEEEKKK